MTLEKVESSFRPPLPLLLTPSTAFLFGNDRGRYGFDNYGLPLSGQPVAVRELPDYAITRTRTRTRTRQYFVRADGFSALPLGRRDSR